MNSHFKTFEIIILGNRVQKRWISYFHPIFSFFAPYELFRVSEKIVNGDSFLKIRHLSLDLVNMIL